MIFPKDRLQNKIAFDFLRKLPLRDRKLKLLDVGGADNLLKNFLPPNIEYFSLDLPPEEQFPEPISGKHNFIIDLDKQKIPVKDNFFDIIISLDVLEHTMYPQKVIDELKRINKPRGVFIISLPNEYNFLQRIYYLLAMKTDTEMPWKVVEKHMHIQKPRVKDIINLLSSNFQIKKVRYHWESRASAKNRIFQYFDKLINFFAKVYPSLFARDVVALCFNK